VEVNGGQEKFQGPALGDFPGFVQVILRTRGAGALAGEKPRTMMPLGMRSCEAARQPPTMAVSSSRRAVWSAV